MNRNIKWWQLVLATVVVSALGAISTGRSKKNERKLYEKKLKQAPWAPPAWVFGPAWSVNNFFLLQALKELLLRHDIPERRKLLIKQAMIWVIFFSFGYVYFKKKSPILAAIWTLADAALAAGSFIEAKRTDKQLSYKYLPLLAWTAYAGSLSIYQAIKNDDPVVG